VQPLTVTVLALVEPGPPDVDDELDTLPPPAWTCTDDPPAELELDKDPADEVDPVVPEPDEPSAVMLPSGCFSTVTLQVSPDAFLPVFSMVSAKAVLPIRAITAIAMLDLFIAFSSNRDEGSGIAAAPFGPRRQSLSLSFFISSLWWPLPFSMPMSPAWPADEPAAPTVEPLLPPPADEPPVPTVEAEFDPEPAAEPPVPRLDELLPPPAEEPPVPSVEAEPEPVPLPAAEPPVPTVELLVPPPADEPPVPSVEAEPEPLPEPADEPPVPIVELLVPPPAELPPVPTVELDCATASAVPASSAAAAADNFRILMSHLLQFFKLPKEAWDKVASIRNVPMAFAPATHEKRCIAVAVTTMRSVDLVAPEQRQIPLLG
jgi:hypothetical protein